MQTANKHTMWLKVIIAKTAARLISAVAFLSAVLLVGCPSSMLVRGTLEGSGTVTLTIPDQPRPRPRLVVNETASIPVQRLRISTERVGAAPGEGYVLATFVQPRPTISGGGGVTDVATAGDSKWLAQHTGELLMGSFYWYEDPADAGVSVNATADRQSGATYLVRYETDDASRLFLRWNEPGVQPLPVNIVLGRRSEPNELDAFPTLQVEVQGCLDRLRAEVEANPPGTVEEQRAILARRQQCLASPIAVAEEYGLTCIRQPCLDMRNLSLAFFTALRNAFEDAAKNIKDVELGGPAKDGNFQMSYVPHVRGSGGQQGFAYIFEGTLAGPLGVSVTVSVPVSVYLFPADFALEQGALVSRTYEAEFDPMEGATPVNLDRIVVRRTAPVGVAWFADPGPIRQQIIDGILGADNFGEALDVFRILLKAEVIRARKRGELLGSGRPPVIPKDFGLIVLPALSTNGTHGTRIMPEEGGVQVMLNFLE